MVRTPAFNHDTALSAALETFWRSGYNGSSVQNLLDAMGINRGSLYHSFGDKEALFKACLDLYSERFTQMVLGLLNQNANSIQGLKAVFNLTLVDIPKQQRQKGCLLVNSVAELSETEPELASHAYRLLQPVRSGFTRALIKAKQEGLWQHPIADPEATAELLFHFLIGLRIDARLNKEAEQLGTTIKQTFAMLGLDSQVP